MCSHLFPVFLIFPPVCPNCSWCSECVTCGRSPAAGPTQSTKKQSVLFTRFPVPCAFQIVCYLCAPYCLLGSQFPVCSRLYPVPYFSLLFSVCFECVPCVFRLFLVFRVCNLWEATSCRANTTYTETVSIVYSVPSSQCGPNCVGCSLYIPQFSWCSQCATYLCVPYCLLCSQFPVCAPCCTVLHFPILFSVCFECVPSVIPTIRCVPSVYIPCVFPMFPVRSLIPPQRVPNFSSLCFPIVPCVMSV